MTELNKWVLIKAVFDEDKHELDIDIDTIGVYDNEDDAKKELKANVEDQCNSIGCELIVSWNDDETKATIITQDDLCRDNWTKVYEIKKI